MVLFYEIGYNYLCGGFEEFVLDLFYEIGYNYLLGGFEEIVLVLFDEIGYNYLLGGFENIVLNLFDDFIGGMLVDPPRRGGVLPLWGRSSM